MGKETETAFVPTMCSTQTRRTFVKGSTLAGLAALTATSTLFNHASEAMAEEDNAEAGKSTLSKAELEGEVIWSSCDGCGPGMCPLQFHVVDGTITYIEGDTTGDKEFGGREMRSCLRGRSLRRYINHPDRIKYPMKRAEGAKRGEGKFEQISWDEAIDLFAEKLQYTIDTYGNEAIIKQTAEGNLGGLFCRLMNMNGGFLDFYGSMSHGQAEAGFQGLFGPATAACWISSPTPTMQDSDLVVMFGSSAATSRISGGNCYYDIAVAREKGARIVNIDPRMGEEESGHPEEWIPIRPGTDAALATALCYVLVKEDMADLDFLHSHCTGFDEETMDEDLKEKNLSYMDYLMGTGYDMVEKTPEWASAITLIPADTIYELARAIGNAKAAYIMQGLGLQRRNNGENASRAIAMVAIVSGHFGLPGTNTGGKPSPCGGPSTGGIPAGENPLDVEISSAAVMEAWDRGAEMTATRDGVRYGEGLSTGVKFAYFCGTNSIANSNVDINWAASVAADESKCEFIVGSDWFMSSTLKYCDLILPEIMPQEALNLRASSGSSFQGFIYGQKVQEPPFECRSEYEWMSAVAEKLGCYDEFTEGKTKDEWQTQGYENVARVNFPNLPSLEEGFEVGYISWPIEHAPAMADFRADPVANPVWTESGKIEIYAKSMQEIAETWEFDDPRDVVSPIPIYNPDFESHEDATEEYPLQVSSFKSKIRYHSKYDQIDLLRQACRHQIWINPVDAESRGIEDGDMVRVWNDRGEIQIEARVTPRVIPGAMVMEEGRNRLLDEDGADIGCNINTLASHHWSPISKHNNCNSILAQAEKL